MISFIIFLSVFVILGFAVNGLVTLILGTVLKLCGKKVDREELSQKCLKWTMDSLVLAFALFVFYLIALTDTVGGAMSFGRATLLLAEILIGAALVIAAIAFVVFLFYRWGKWIDR